MLGGCEGAYDAESTRSHTREKCGGDVDVGEQGEDASERDEDEESNDDVEDEEEEKDEEEDKKEGEDGEENDAEEEEEEAVDEVEEAEGNEQEEGVDASVWLPIPRAPTTNDTLFECPTNSSTSSAEGDCVDDG